MSEVIVIHGGTGRRSDPRRLVRLRRHLRAVADSAYRVVTQAGAVEAVVVRRGVRISGYAQGHSSNGH